MNPEYRAMRAIDSRLEKRLELSPLMKKAHEKASQEVFSNEDYVIKEKDFIPVYGEDNVAADIAETQRLERLFAKDETPQTRHSHMIAEVFEAITLMHSELSGWLGDAHTLKTAKFDDFKNKTDLIAEWYSPEDGSRVLALAVDVTFGTMTLNKKLEGIKKEIDSGTLGSLRYFKDVRGDFMGTRRNIPRTVIGISAPVVDELAGMWTRGENKKLGEHPIQRLIIEQIMDQLEKMHEYATRHGKTNVAEAYQQAMKTLRPLRAKKMGIRLGELQADKVAEQIKSSTRSIFS
jgi:hypothetical protein